MKSLIIVGCGPKAVAIAAKAYVLKNLGWEVPNIIIIDKHGPGANWDGSNGYTDGNTILGTTPFEDVGFPYASEIDKNIDSEMLKFSYSAYLIEIGKYAEWVDRFLTPPTHKMLADYLKWVIDKINFPVIIGEVTSISKKDENWIVKLRNNSDSREVTGDVLVITGPGSPLTFPLNKKSSENIERIFNGQNFWHNLHAFSNLRNTKIAVIGGGETAAGIMTGLLKLIDSSSKIEIITPNPILFTRNEHWMEVMYFSKVMDWAELSEQTKIDIISHADRGTFSVEAKNLIDSAYNVGVKQGTAKKIDLYDDGASLTITLKGENQESKYDYIIEATGFNAFSFIELFSDQSIFSNTASIPEGIDYDLSIKELVPKLHLPGLSAMAQGPGFPNLSCLGLLSERILQPYIRHKELEPKRDS